MKAEYKFPIRLNQYLARTGLCSRRQADLLIEEGKITVNGTTAQLGEQVLPLDEVRANGRLVKLPEELLTYAYYKPKGIVCTREDPHIPEQDTVAYVVKNVLKLPGNIIYAGRLDRESEGLLLLTNDGILSQEMMKGANHHEKEYEVRVDHPLTRQTVMDLMHGVYLPELDITTRPCRVRVDDRDNRKMYMLLTQGLNRQIRRMCAVFGYQVISLLRTRIMNVTIDGMRSGDCRELFEGEARELYRQARSAAGL